MDRPVLGTRDSVHTHTHVHAYTHTQTHTHTHTSTHARMHTQEAVDVFTHVTKFFQAYCHEDGLLRCLT